MGRQVGVDAAAADIVEVLRALDVNDDGRVDVEDWLRAVRGPLNRQRAALLRQAFHRIDADGDGLVSVADLQLRFVPECLPYVEAGWVHPQEAWHDLLVELTAAAAAAASRWPTSRATTSTSP